MPVDTGEAERCVMGCAVFSVMQSPCKDALKHARYLRQRYNALRSSGLKDGIGTGLDMRLVEQDVRRVRRLGREACLDERCANGEAIHNHHDERLFFDVRQIGP